MIESPNYKVKIDQLATIAQAVEDPKVALELGQSDDFVRTVLNTLIDPDNKGKSVRDAKIALSSLKILLLIADVSKEVSDLEGVNTVEIICKVLACFNARNYLLQETGLQLLNSLAVRSHDRSTFTSIVLDRISGKYHESDEQCRREYNKLIDSLV